MRWIHGLFVFVFTLAAILQYNDPDPVRWIAVYGFAALVAAQAVSGRAMHRVIPLMLAVTCAVWMVALAGGMADFVRQGDWRLLAATMHAGQPMIEEAREFLGLAIVLIHSGWVTLRRKSV